MKYFRVPRKKNPIGSTVSFMSASSNHLSLPIDLAMRAVGSQHALGLLPSNPTPFLQVGGWLSSRKPMPRLGEAQVHSGKA